MLEGEDSMRLRTALAGVVLAVALATAADAEPYPAKTVTIIAPAAPGGVTDRMARMLASQLAAAWGNQVIVENKPGANNQIAAEYVARSAADGATLFLSPEATFVVNPYIYGKLQYHLQDFAPITGLFAIYQCLCATPSLPANSVAELIALAKEKPGALNYGTFGVGSSGHLNMEMLAKMAGVKLTAVHYKGAAPATNDVIAGHIQLVSVAIGSAVPQIEGHKLKALGVGSPKRHARLPDIPAVAETVPGYEARSWFGLFAPAKTPAALVDRINGDVREVFKKPELKTFLDREFFEPMTSSPADFLAFIHAEEAKWSKVVQDAGVKLN
jgi:tripartite-type tricarboxylate transporter receptor subunit TctC